MKKERGLTDGRGARRKTPASGAGPASRLFREDRGAVLVEVAFSFPILLILLMGILAYGSWMMVAHTIQQAANEAARAAIAGISDTERQTLANDSVTHSLGAATFLNPALITVTTSQSGGFYSVAVSYDASQSQLFSIAPVPLPAGIIRRAAVVKLGSV